MRRLVAAVALAFPLCAGADLVRVEYEGVVNSVRRSVCDACDPTRNYAPDHPEFTNYSVGDRIRGFMEIDLAVAPADSRPLQPELGLYSAPGRSGGFISGNGAPRFHLVFQDDVAVRDRSAEHSDEHYLITDQWTSANGTGQMSLNVISREGGPDFITGDGLAQTFDATPGRGFEITGHLSKVVNGVKGSVSVLASLLFDRVKMTSPGTCKA